MLIKTQSQNTRAVNEHDVVECWSVRENSTSHTVFIQRTNWSLPYTAVPHPAILLCAPTWHLSFTSILRSNIWFFLSLLITTFTRHICKKITHHHAWHHHLHVRLRDVIAIPPSRSWGKVKLVVLSRISIFSNNMASIKSGWRVPGFGRSLRWPEIKGRGENTLLRSALDGTEDP